MPVRCLSFEELDVHTAYDVWRLRQEVFVVEQECPYADLDGRDPEPGTRHLLLELDGALTGYLRLLDEESCLRIGRVLLARAYRGLGWADELMRAAMTEVGDRPARLDAQSPLARWYARYGFAVSGPEFTEDGIAHLPMERLT